MLFDYFTTADHQGHNPSERKLDSTQARYGLDTKPLFEVENIILVGRSLGSGPALELAAYACQALGRKPAALILISAF